jgi:adenosylcobinamide-GDP ribazoletransferase
VVAFQFLTRIPMHSARFGADALPRAIKFFPLVGLVVGSGAALLHRLLMPHLSRPLVAFVVLTYFVLITGCFHEDGLADTADGFGGGWNREQILVILKDSRIGSYGATALILSLLSRYLLLASLPLEHFAAYVISAHVLCRWSSLPLSYFLPAARESDSQGARIAHLTSLSSLTIGSFLSFAVVIFALRWAALAPIIAALLVTFSSGRFYYKRIGGVTGDCFGATNQLTEIAVYLCGEWHR